MTLQLLADLSDFSDDEYNDDWESPQDAIGLSNEHLPNPHFSNNVNPDHANDEGLVQRHLTTPTFFMSHWSEFTNGQESAELVKATWDIFAGSGSDCVGLVVVENMIYQFFTAIPDLDRILVHVPEEALLGLINQHVQIKMSAMFGPVHDRSSDVITRVHFNASFGDLFSGAGKLTGRSTTENAFQETSMSSLAELDRKLQSISSIVMARLEADSVQAVAKRVLRKEPGIRLINELRWLTSLIESGLDRLNVPYHLRIEIARYLQPQVVQAGETIFFEGQQDFFALIDGNMNVMRMNGLGIWASISDLSSGATFGEVNLMLWGRRPTPLLARRQTVIGILDYSWFKHLLYPSLHSVHSAKLSYFRKIPYLASISIDKLSEIAYMAKIKHFSSLEVIFQQGQVMPSSILFIKVGRVRIIREVPQSAKLQTLMLSGKSYSRFSAMPSRSSSTCTSVLGNGRHFSSKIARDQGRRPKSAVCPPAGSGRVASACSTEYRQSGQGVFLECCIVEHLTALGEIIDERLKVQYKWRVSAIALDRVTAFEVPNHLLLQYANTISPNLYRCPPDIKLVRYLKATEAWDAYRSRQEGPGENGFFSSRHIYRVVRSAARATPAPDRIGDVLHMRKITGLIDNLDLHSIMPGDHIQ